MEIIRRQNSSGGAGAVSGDGEFVILVLQIFLGCLNTIVDI